MKVTYQTLQVATKSFVRDNFIAINAYKAFLRNKVLNKQPNFIPQGSRKRRANEAQIW